MTSSLTIVYSEEKLMIILKSAYKELIIIIKLSEKLSENPNIIKNTCIHVEVMAINSNY